MIRSHNALALIASVLAAAGCGAPDENYSEAQKAALGCVTYGGAWFCGVDAGPATGSDAPPGPGSDAGSGTGSDGGPGTGSDGGPGTGSDGGTGPGSDGGTGPGSDGGSPTPDAGTPPDDCPDGDGLVKLDPYSAQYNVAGDSVFVSPHSMTEAPPYSFSATSLPPGLSIDETSGHISGTLTDSSYVGSPYRVTIYITSATLSRVVSFNWRIDRKEIPRRESTVGESISSALPAAPGLAPYVYVATGLPPGLSVNVISGNVTGTIPLSTKPGAYPVTVSTTGGPITDSYTFLWWVFGPSQQTTTADPRDQNTWEGQEAELALPVPAGGALAYQVDNLPPGLFFDAGTRRILGVVVPGAVDGSPYQVQVRATTSTGVTTYSFRWTIYSETVTTVPLRFTTHTAAADAN